MTPRRTSDLLVECLEAEGVRHVFGIPGEETLDLNESLERSTVDFVPVRHEQGAAYMADMHGRLTGRAGVCLGTLGPGALNLVTAVADAFLDRAPLVALTGQGDMERMHKESHQYIDLVEVMRPITKWNARVSNPQIVPEVVRKAFKVAESQKPGSTHLELPEDVMAADAVGEPIPRRTPVQSDPGTREIERATEIIRGAARPVALVGHGVLRNHAAGALREFVRATRIPAAETFMGKGAVDADDELALGTVGLQERDYALAGFADADVVMSRFEAARDDDAFPLPPPRALWEIRQALGREDILVSDVGLHKLWIARMFPAHEPDTVLIANGLAGMGFALPCAIAAKLVHPGRNVVTVAGDGGFLMNVSELETAKRLRTPIVNVIWENEQYGSVYKQEKRFGAHFGTDFTNPDFVMLARAFGLPAWRCASAEDFGQRLRHALTLDEPSVVVLPVDDSIDVAISQELGEDTVTRT